MKKLISAVILAALLLTGCAYTAQDFRQAAAAQSAASAPSVTPGTAFTDALGFEVTVDAPKAVAALSGSYAETWLLAGGTLAAVTDDAVSERALDIGSAVSVGSLKEPSAEQLIAAGVDFAILSADISGQVEMRDTLENAGITCAYFSVEIFEDYLKMLKICTDITGRADLYAENGTAVAEQISAVREAIKGEESPTVLLIRAYSTGAKVKDSDNMTGAMLKDLGCVNIADSDASLLEDLSLEKIIEADPDYIFVTTMGSSDAALAALAESLLDNPAWSTLTAVKQGRYNVLPSALYHYKPNNRWGEAYAGLAEILYGYEA